MEKKYLNYWYIVVDLAVRPLSMTKVNINGYCKLVIKVSFSPSQLDCNVSMKFIKLWYKLKTDDFFPNKAKACIIDVFANQKIKNI